jgi:predicted DNA-binding helix-hairpin-helix protein
MVDLERLEILSSDMHLEPAEDTGCPKLAENPKMPYLSSAALPNGKRVTLLKTLLTSACERNCFYCPFRAGRDFRRATFKPEEFAHTYMALHQAGITQGTFLSSGIVGGGVRTQDLLIDAADILRNKFNYRGYLHLKIMPGAERAQVERSMQLADRVSINLEAPNDLRLGLLAPRKQFMDELFAPLRWVDEIRRTRPSHLGWQNRWPSSVTQFVVGGVGETDLELLTTTEYLYRNLHLRRAYFSAFHPIPDTPLENQRAESPVRQHRLYQASFLLRDYGFVMEDLALDPSGNLPLEIDPKLAWAQHNLAGTPVEINRAARSELLRIPGIGPRTVDQILTARRLGRIRNLSQIGKMGANTSKIAPFILLDGQRPVYQYSLW